MNGGNTKNSVIELIKELAIIGAIVIVIRSSIFTIHMVPTGSMLPTIYLGDRLFVNRLAYGLVLPFMETQVLSWSKPKRGDIVTFPNPKTHETYIKRVVGIGGDEIKFDDGKLTINGKSVTETPVDRKDVFREAAIDPSMSELFEEKGLLENEMTHYSFRYQFERALQLKIQIDRTLSPLDENFYAPTRMDSRIFKVPEGKILCIGDNRDNSLDGRFWGYLDEKSIFGKALFITFSTVQPRDDQDAKEAHRAGREPEDLPYPTHFNEGIFPEFRFERILRPLSKLP